MQLRLMDMYLKYAGDNGTSTIRKVFCMTVLVTMARGTGLRTSIRRRIAKHSFRWLYPVRRYLIVDITLSVQLDQLGAAQAPPAFTYSARFQLDS